MFDWAGRMVLFSQRVTVGRQLDLGFHSRLEIGYRALADTLGIDARHVSECDNSRCDYDTRKDMQKEDNLIKRCSGRNKERLLTRKCS
jgi:predicted sulfurtransferase